MCKPKALSTASVVLLFVTAAAAQRSTSFSEEFRDFVTVDAPAVVLRGVRVFDGTGRPPANAQAIVIRDGRSVSIGPRSTVVIPKDAKVIDLAEHTVIPGIIGMHDHLYGYDIDHRQAARLYLAGGVTSLRTTGTFEPYRDINLKREIDAGIAIGPRIHLTSPYFTGPASRNLGSIRISAPEQARRAIDYWAEEGATWIKVYRQIRRTELVSVIKHSHARGLKVTGDLCATSAREAADAGIDNVEHGPTARDFDSQLPPDICPPVDLPQTWGGETPEAGVDATARYLASKGVAVTATLPVSDAVARGLNDPRVFDFMNPAQLDSYRQMVARAASTTRFTAYFTMEKTFHRRFVEAGGLLVAGTDPVAPGVLPGLADQRNYELLREVGFTAQLAIQIMSANAAKLLGVDRQLGTLQPGKIADLVVVRADPASDLTAIRDIELVFKHGIGFDSAKVLAAVRQALARH